MSTLTRVLRNFWVAPVVAGVVHWLAFPPFDVGLLAPLAWALLFASMRVRRGEHAGKQAFVMGLVLFIPGLTWMRPLVASGWIFAGAFCAAHEAVFAWLAARFWFRGGAGVSPGWIVGVPVLHLLLDGVRTYALSGFPWLLVGYTGWQNPVLLGGASLMGVHGATLAILLAGAGLGELLARRATGATSSARVLVPALSWWGSLLLWGLVFPAPATEPGPRLALLQANFPQHLKERRIAEGSAPAGEGEWLGRHIALIDEAHRRAEEEGLPIDVIVWPETMYPPSPAAHDLPASPNVWREVAAFSRGPQTLVGIITRDQLGRRWNSVVLVQPDGRATHIQDKQHLTPGGEYIPLLDSMPFRDRIEAALIEKAGFLPDLTAGDRIELLPVRYADGVAEVGVLICIESVFPELARAQVREGAAFLLNASNYGWFVGTPLMKQTEAMACFRAAEMRTSVVLTSNNGPSVVIGPDGVPGEGVRDAAGYGTDVSGVAIVTVPLVSEPPSALAAPFRSLGELPVWLLGVLALCAGFRTRRRRLSATPGGPENPSHVANDDQNSGVRGTPNETAGGASS